MLRMRLAAVCAGAAAVALGVPGCNKNRAARSSSTTTSSRTYSTTEPGMPGREVSADTSFLQAAAMGGHAEVELSNLAVRQATRQDVREFAQRMVDDHTRANNQVADLARARNITLPSQPDTRHREAAERLMTMRGDDFDRQYLQIMLDDHQQTVAKFEQKASDAQDPEIRRFASQTLPTLREHLEMVRGLVNGTPMGGMSR